MLEQELRVLHLDLGAGRRRLSFADNQEEGISSAPGKAWSLGDLKVHIYNDTLIPTRLHFLIMLLPKPNIYKPSLGESLGLPRDPEQQWLFGSLWGNPS